MTPLHERILKVTYWKGSESLHFFRLYVGGKDVRRYASKDAPALSRPRWRPERGLG